MIYPILITATQFFNNANLCMIAIFNSGIVFRIIMSCVSSYFDESVNLKKKLINQIKVAIVINCTLLIINFLKNYY